MKKKNLLTIIISISPMLKLLSAQPQINNNINIYASTNQTTNTSNTLTAMQQTMPTSLLKELAHDSGSFINNHKLLISLLVGTYTYGRTFVSVVQANHELARETAWASWKAELSLEELKDLAPETLTKELLLEIQKRHTTVEKPADALLPFITFLGAIDKEISTINHYRSLYFWLESFHATKLFPLNKNRFASASSRLDRLWFIKNLFLNWAAEYKLSTLMPRSTNSTALRLYRYFSNKLNLGSHDCKHNDHTRTAITTLAETACCAQVIALIGALLTSSRTIDNTVNISL